MPGRDPGRLPPNAAGSGRLIAAPTGRIGDAAKHPQQLARRGAGDANDPPADSRRACSFIALSEPVRRLQHVIAEVHQDLRHFSAGGGAGGIQLAVALAVDDVVLHGPAHGLLGPGGHLVGVGEGSQAVHIADVVALELAVAIENGGHFLPGDGGVGVKLVVALALDDAAGRCPVDRVGVPGALGHIVKHGGCKF